ncbi:MAG: hypothetical protein U0T83_03570 [Bacteriovoracaceae bacterium]
MKLIKVAILTLSFLSLNAFAKMTVIEDQKCLDVTSDLVGKALVDYGSYKNIDNQLKYDIEVLGLQLRFIDMIKSEPYTIMNNGEVSKTIVQFVFQALNLTKSELFPHFHLLCLTNAKTVGRFAQKCDLIESYDKNGANIKLPRFAMKNFSSLIVAQDNSPSCPKGKTLLNYKVNIDTDDSEVYKIKMEVSMGFSPIARIIDKIFDESTFFRNYYVNFYEAWIKQL